MRKILIPFLGLMLASAGTCDSLFLAQPAIAQSTAMLDEDANLDEVINVPGGSKKVSVDVTGESIRTVLRDLATRGGFNLVMDDSVTGNVTVALSNVTVNQALQSVATLSDIHILPQNGNIYLAISRQAAQDKGLSHQLSKVIKIYYSNANRIASVLNSSIFSTPSTASGSTSGGQTLQKARPDSRTNSIIVVGTAREIELAESAVRKLDAPRQSKTFYLSQANALNVASMLASSIFNDGTASLSVGSSGGGSSASSSGGAGVTPSTMRVDREDLQEGTGINNFGGSGSSSGSSSAGLSSTVTLRGTVKTTDTVQVSPTGPLVIPDTRQNAVTVMGTAEQIAMAEALIPTLDAQLPQVAIEAALVEITNTGTKELATRWGVADGRLQLGFNNQALEGVNSVTGLPATVQPADTGLTGLPTVDSTEQNAFSRSGIAFSTNPLTSASDYVTQVRTLISTNKAKILANPTVVATHDTESIISIVNEVVRRVTTNASSEGFVTQTVEIGEAGIVLDILPKVGEDGTISMRLRPSVSSVLGIRSVAGTTVTLLSKRDMLTQNVRVQDGQTLAIGGLISESNNLREDKLPLIGDAPIVGAMFRASRRNTSRSELVLLITPHIMSKTNITPTNTASLNLSGSIPVASNLAGGEK